MPGHYPGRGGRARPNRVPAAPAPRGYAPGVAIHDAARGFERAADAYERGRPEYPEAAVARVAAALRLGPGVRLLAASGATVLAADPAGAMIRRGAGVAGVVPLRAVAEALPLRGGSLDAAT